LTYAVFNVGIPVRLVLILEKLIDAWEKRPTKETRTIPSSLQSGKGSSKVPSVGELPPEVTAPGLKNLPKPAGFGSSSGDSNSDTQLHSRDTSKTRSKGNTQSVDSDNSPDSAIADSAEANPKKKKRGGG